MLAEGLASTSNIVVAAVANKLEPGMVIVARAIQAKSPKSFDPHLVVLVSGYIENLLQTESVWIHLYLLCPVVPKHIVLAMLRIAVRIHSSHGEY